MQKKKSIDNTDHRKSDICWLDRLEWEWLYSRVDEWMKIINPNLEMKNPERMQLTKYIEGCYFGWHIDNSVDLTRTLSATILLQPSEEGGILEFDPIPFDEPLMAGDAVAFDSSIYHQVTPVTKGTRYSLVRWLN